MLNLKNYFKIFKKKPTLSWSDTSGAMYSIIKLFIKKKDNILEFGSSTGHISFRLAQKGYSLTLLDIRKNVVEEARMVFEKEKLNGNFIVEDIFLHDKKYDFAWNSGLVQCFDDLQKENLIKKISELAPKVLLFYPDTENKTKDRGTNDLQIPGVGDAKEYDIHNVPDIMYKYFGRIYFGKIAGDSIGLSFDMLWIFGENK